MLKLMDKICALVEHLNGKNFTFTWKVVDLNLVGRGWPVYLASVGPGKWMRYCQVHPLPLHYEKSLQVLEHGFLLFS